MSIARSCVCGFAGNPVAGLASRFLQQANVLDTHAAVDRLAHVVNGQEGDGRGGQRLHLDAGAAKAFGGDGAMHGILCDVDRELGADSGQG